MILAHDGNTVPDVLSYAMQAFFFIYVGKKLPKEGESRGGEERRESGEMRTVGNN